MKVGNLVRIQRASIGVPKGTVGLIVETTEREPVNALHDATYFVHHIQLCGIAERQGGYRQYLERDLEIIN